MRVLGRLMVYLKHHKRAVLLAYMGLAGSVAFGSLTPWMLKRAIDIGIAGNSDRVLFLSAAAILLFSIVKGLFAYLQSFMGEYLSQKIAFDLRRDFYARVQSLSFAFHDQAETGQLMARATVDVDVSRQFLSMGLLRATYTFSLFFVVAGIMLTMDWQLAMLVMVSIPLVSGVSVLMARRTRPLWLQVQQQLGVETSVLEESITGIRVVKAFAQEERQFERFQLANWSVRERSIQANRIAAFNQPFLLFILNLVSVAILWYGGHLVMGGSLTIGTLVAFTEYRSQMAAPVRTLGFLVNLSTRASSAAERIFEVIDTVSEVKESPDARPLEGVRGHVRYEGVAFSYSKRAPVVRDISIEAPPGRTVAILGATGSGKSTIVNLLPRFYDVTDGRITIDGVDIRDVTLESLRRAVGVVGQEVFLFNGPVRENIAYGKPEATTDEIEHAARIAQMHDFIVSLPDGYETWVGERGITLSGGQKQRIAIARTLLMDPRVLVLDDSTSAVDMETEYLIQQALADLMRNRTSFVIAHRLRTVTHADEILVLDRGSIVQRGRHEDLLRQAGPYREIYHMQLEGRDEAEPVSALGEAAS